MELSHLDIDGSSEHTENIGCGLMLDIFDDLLQEPSALCGGGAYQRLGAESFDRESIRDEVQRVCSEVIAEFPDACVDLRPCLYIIKYLVQNARNISSGSMHISNFLRIFWLIHKEDYRCHMGNFYKYHRGAWVLHDEKNSIRTTSLRLRKRARVSSLRYHAGR